MAGKQVAIGVGIAVLVGGAIAGMFALQIMEVSDAVANLDTIAEDTPWTSKSKKTKKRRDRAWRVVRKLTNLEPSPDRVLARLDGEANMGLEGAMVAAGDLEVSGAVPKLLEFLKGEDARKREVAGYALSLYTPCPSALPAMLGEELSPETREAVYAAMAESLDKAVRMEVAKGLEESEPAIRTIAVKALGKNTAPEAHVALVKALEDASDEVGAAAVKALSGRSESTRDKEARKVLRGLVDSERPEVRARALAVCAATHESSVAEKAVPLLNDPHPGVAAAAIAMMKSAEYAAAGPQIAQMLTRNEPEVIAAAADALKALAPPTADEALLELLVHDQLHTRIAAAQLIGFIDNLAIKEEMKRTPWSLLEKPYVPRLIAMLESDEKGEAAAALAGLHSFATRTNFRAKGDSAMAWKGWLGMLTVESAKLKAIEKIFYEAVDVYEHRQTTNYKPHIHKLRDAVAMYDELRDNGALSKYEHGVFGIKKLNELIWIMQKTAGF